MYNMNNRTMEEQWTGTLQNINRKKAQYHDVV